MSDQNNYQSICRTCLRRTDDLKAIFEQQLNEKLIACANIKVNYLLIYNYIYYTQNHFQVDIGDGLPDTICTNCIERVENAFSFKQLCEESEAKLKQENIVLSNELSLNINCSIKEYENDVKTENYNIEIESNEEYECAIQEDLKNECDEISISETKDCKNNKKRRKNKIVNNEGI